MRSLEQQIMESGEASVANASMVDMQQVMLSSIKRSLLIISVPPPCVVTYDFVETDYYKVDSSMQ